MKVDLIGVLSDLSGRRPIFHSEGDFQFALAWAVQTRYTAAQIRLEPRPRRATDMLVRLDGYRFAVELFDL